MANTVNTTNLPTDWAWILGSVAGMTVRNDDSREVIAEMRRNRVVKNGLAGWLTLTRKGQFALYAAAQLANQRAGR
jgi:hypothetical protein